MKTGETGRTASARLWGRMAGLSASTRIVSLVFVAAIIVALSFCQLAFWPIPEIDGRPVYLMLMLGPLLMGALLFGALMGALLGLFAGAVLYAHATFFALDYYEIYFMTPLNTFLLLAVIGGVAGWLFSVIARRVASGGMRRAFIAATCLVLSIAASFLTMGNLLVFYGGVHALDAFESLASFLFPSPFGVVVQILIDAAAMALACCLADWAVERATLRGSNRHVQSVFRNWLLLVSAIVFMLVSAFTFSATTLQARSTSSAEMLSEVTYLERQLAAQGNADADVLLDGYDPSLDGWVVITDADGTVLASDDEERFPAGGSLIAILGFEGMVESPAMFFEPVAASKQTATIQAPSFDGRPSMDMAFLNMGAYDGGFVMMMKPSEMVYSSRLGIMVSLTILAVLLIAAIGLLATALLKRVVVRRIDETNGSLEKITAGNLHERVHRQDTVEFTSLADGINTTVAALGDMMDEIATRNAQDLATAKAIQESALPREFPPFPDIDKFDIYASMKTAKEVGGDFYDFFLIEDGAEGASKLGFVMADVSGKGIPAALFMMTAKTQIRNFMEAGLSVGEAIDAANHQLCIGNDAGMFVTTWVGALDYNTGLLTFVNGGHNPPMLLHDGSWDWVKEVSGMPLGLFDGIPYDEHTRQLEPGDMLYTYTDGVTEAMDVDGNLFNEDRLEETLSKYKDMNPRSVGVGVRRALTDFTLDAEQSDDITMLVLKYGVPPESQAVMVLDADDKQLVHVVNFINEELKRRHAPKSVFNPLAIAAEELFVNVCHYAYPDATPGEPGEVRISYEYCPSPTSLKVTISDDGIPYDPLAKPDPEAHDNIADVPIGGLGIFMTKKSVDDISYERVGDSNVVTFVKRW